MACAKIHPAVQQTKSLPLIHNLEGWAIGIFQDSIQFRFLGKKTYTFPLHDFVWGMGRNEPRVGSETDIIRRVNPHTLALAQRQKMSDEVVMSQGVVDRALTLICLVQFEEWERIYPEMLCIHGRRSHIRDLAEAIVVRVIWRRVYCISLEGCLRCQDNIRFRKTCRHTTIHRICDSNLVPSLRYIQLAWVVFSPYYLGAQSFIDGLVERGNVEIDPAYIMQSIVDAAFTPHDIHAAIHAMVLGGKTYEYNLFTERDGRSVCSCFMSGRIRTLPE